MPVKEKKTVLYTVIYIGQHGTELVSFKKSDEATEYATMLAQEIDPGVEDYIELSETTKGKESIDVVPNELREYFEVADEAASG